MKSLLRKLDDIQLDIDKLIKMYAEDLASFESYKADYLEEFEDESKAIEILDKLRLNIHAATTKLSKIDTKNLVQ